MASRYRSVRSLMGLIWTNIVRNQKEQAFRDYFQLSADQKVIISVGLYFERKGIVDFVEIARRMPEYTFIWFGHTPMYTIPKSGSRSRERKPS